MPTTPDQRIVQTKLMKSIRSGDLRLFSEALSEMAPATEGDTWPRDALELAIRRRSWSTDEKSVQSRLVENLLAMPTPPRPVNGCGFIKQIVELDALHLWDTLVAKGFEGDGDELLDYILRGKFYHFEISPSRKGQWLEKLLQSPLAPDPVKGSQRGEWPEAALERVLLCEDYLLIPMLHEAGYTLPDTMRNRFFMGSSVAKGHWPHPDLVLPGFLLQEDGVEGFFSRLYASFSDSAFLSDPTHIHRFCQLPMSDRDMMTRKITSIAASDGGDPNRFLLPVPNDTVQCMLLLHSNHLLDLDALLCSVDLPRPAAHMIDSTRLEVNARRLNDGTPPALVSRIGSPRL